MEEDTLSKEYIEFVMTTIANYRKYSDRLTSDLSEVHPQDVQYILANYQSVKLGLLSEVGRRQSAYRQMKRQFNLWWNTCTSVARTELIANITKGGKYPAVKDYTLQAEENNKEEYARRQEELQNAEDKLEFMKSLRDDWGSFQYILQVLNSNMTSELRSLSVDRDSGARTRTKRTD